MAEPCLTVMTWLVSAMLMLYKMVDFSQDDHYHRLRDSIVISHQCELAVKISMTRLGCYFTANDERELTGIEHRAELDCHHTQDSTKTISKIDFTDGLTRKWDLLQESSALKRPISMLRGFAEGKLAEHIWSLMSFIIHLWLFQDAIIIKNNA